MCNYSVNCLSLIMHFCPLCSFIFFRVGACVPYGAVLVGFSRPLIDCICIQDIYEYKPQKATLTTVPVSNSCCAVGILYG